MRVRGSRAFDGAGRVAARADVVRSPAFGRNAVTPSAGIVGVPRAGVLVAEVPRGRPRAVERRYVLLRAACAAMYSFVRRSISAGETDSTRDAIHHVTPKGSRTPPWRSP